MNTTDQYKRALRACNEGLLKLTRDDEGRELFCYTQDCFWGKDTWNDLTKTHRGAMYYHGQQVNKPFDKIFNLDEQPETDIDVVADRMKSEPYNVYAKANGHLFIISCFKDKKGEQHVVFHTKGGMPGPNNDLLNDDVQIFASLYNNNFQMDRLVNQFPNSTWMFEAIVSHDKHTMYENEVELYGSENCFVLLGANVFDGENWVEAPYDDLSILSDHIGCPIVVRYHSGVEGTPDTWVNHVDTEGYVIHFTETGDRVKIKTKEYWAIRFKKDLTAERILSMYRQSGDGKIRDKLPEEVADQVSEVIESEYELWLSDFHFCHRDMWDLLWEFVERYVDGDETLSREERSNLFSRDDLILPQKQYLVAIADGKNPVEKAKQSRNLRTKFVDYCLYHRMSVLDKELKEIIDVM